MNVSIDGDMVGFAQRVFFFVKKWIVADVGGGNVPGVDGFAYWWGGC
jgi:hypothetical protein